MTEETAADEATRYAEAGRDHGRRRTDGWLRAPVSQIFPATRVIAVRQEESLREAARRMVAADVGALCVVGAGGRLVGIVTERDMLAKAVAVARVPDELTVREAMTAAPVTLRSSDTVAEAFRAMDAGRRYRHLPVVDAEGRAVALVALRDLAALIVEGWPAPVRHRAPAAHDAPAAREGS